MMFKLPNTATASLSKCPSSIFAKQLKCWKLHDRCFTRQGIGPPSLTT